jgi:hypothetical protein
MQSAAMTPGKTLMVNPKYITRIGGKKRIEPLTETVVDTAKNTKFGAYVSLV